MVAGVFATTAWAAQPVPINWQQNSISWGQLQSLFNSNPGRTQFNIRFPNGATWNVNASQMMSIYSDYSQQARAMGYKGDLSSLSFSSLASGVPGALSSIPIGNAVSDMKLAMQNAVYGIDNLQVYLDSLPDWLRDIIVMIYIGAMKIYNFAAEQISLLF
jgi:hypothetical protein